MLFKRKQLFLLQCHQVPMLKQMDAPFLKRVQVSFFVSGAVTITATRSSGRGAGGKIQAHILIAQMRCGKGVAALDKAQVGGGMRPQRLAVGEQKIKRAVRADAPRQVLPG